MRLVAGQRHAGQADVGQVPLRQFNGQVHGPVSAAGVAILLPDGLGRRVKLLLEGFVPTHVGLLPRRLEGLNFRLVALRKALVVPSTHGDVVPVGIHRTAGGPRGNLNGPQPVGGVVACPWGIGVHHQIIAPGGDDGVADVGPRRGVSAFGHVDIPARLIVPAGGVVGPVPRGSSAGTWGGHTAVARLGGAGNLAPRRRGKGSNAPVRPLRGKPIGGSGRSRCAPGSHWGIGYVHRIGVLFRSGRGHNAPPFLI